MLRARLLKGAILTGVALTAGPLLTSVAEAQCRDNFPVFIPGTPPSAFLPLGSGSSLSALISTINTVNTAFLTTTSAFLSAPGNPQPDQQGGGAWGRAVAGTVDTQSTTTSNLSILTVP